MNQAELAAIVAQYDALFLDNDGTCARTEELHAQIGADILTELGGVPMTFEERLAYMGFGEHGIWDDLNAKGRPPVITKDEFKDMQGQRFIEALKTIEPDKLVRPGIIELAKAFKAASKPVIVVSNTARDVVEAIQKAVGLDKIVDTVIALDDIYAHGLKAKPDPGAYLLAQSMVPGNRFLAIEDAYKGWEAAHLSGCDTIHIYYKSIGQTPNPSATFTVADDLDVRRAFKKAADPAPEAPSDLANVPPSGPAPTTLDL